MDRAAFTIGMSYFLRGLMLKRQPGLDTTASLLSRSWPSRRVSARARPPAGPPSPDPQAAAWQCRGRMRAAGVSRLWRINIPGTSPRQPAHAEENITAISGGSSACTQYLDGEFGVINLALSSSLRGPWGSGMFGMGKKLGSAAILPGALWGSARAAAVPGVGCRPPMAPRRVDHPRLWPLADCQQIKVCWVQNLSLSHTPGLSLLLASHVGVTDPRWSCGFSARPATSLGLRLLICATERGIPALPPQGRITAVIPILWRRALRL